MISLSKKDTNILSHNTFTVWCLHFMIRIELPGNIDRCGLHWAEVKDIKW